MKREKKKGILQSHNISAQLVVATFIVSVFTGILLSVSINTWLHTNLKIILSQQKKIEAQKLDFLLKNKEIGKLN